MSRLSIAPVEAMLRDVTTTVIWNVSAGSAFRAKTVYEQFRALPNVSLRESADRQQAIKETVCACHNGASLVIAAGGDGTVSAVAEGLMCMNPGSATLGIVPLGTGNDLARSLDIPLDPEAALEAIGRSVRPIDLACLTSSEGTRWYANMMTGGNTGRQMETITDENKRRWGPFCYLRGVIDGLRDLATYRVTVSCDDGPPESFESINVFVANGRTSGGGLAVCPIAELDDGCIDLVVIRDGKAGDIATLAVDYLLDSYVGHELVVVRRARKIVIDAEPPLPLTADGELAGLTPLRVEARRHCLRVVVPAV